MLQAILTYICFSFIAIYCNAEQNTLDSIQKELMDITISFPSTGVCSGSYFIDKTVTEAVITSNKSPETPNYDDNMLCIWRIETKKGARVQVRQCNYMTHLRLNSNTFIPNAFGIN